MKCKFSCCIQSSSPGHGKSAKKADFTWVTTSLWFLWKNLGKKRVFDL